MKINSKILALGLFSSLALSGCESIKPHFNGDSSMRIAVDVYKGPLALDPELQWGRLLGYVRESQSALNHVIKSTMEFSRHISGQNFPDKTVKHPKDICVLGTEAEANSARMAKLYYQLPLNMNADAEQERKEQAAFNRDQAKFHDRVEMGKWALILQSPNRKKAQRDYKAAKKALKDKKRELALLDQNMSQLVILSALMVDACEAWSFVWRTREEALVWTGQYNEFQGKAASISGIFPKNKNESVHNSPPEILLKTAQEQRAALQGILGQFGEIGARMQTKAAYWAWAHANSPNSDIRVRQTMMALSLVLSEYANRVVSAADALLKQTYYADRRALPISDLIRDTKPTHLSRQLIFNGVIGSRLPHEKQNRDYQYDRYRMIEQVYDDESWSNVNQAYASGRGDVAQVFIKDDVGNWNLKSFDQNPGDVVQTYRDLGIGTIQTAVTLLQGGTNNLTQAKELFSFGNQILLGNSMADLTSGEKEIQSIRQSTSAQLKALIEEVQTQKENLQSRLSKHEMKDTQTPLNNAQNVYNEAVKTDDPLLAQKFAALQTASAQHLDNENQKNQIQTQLANLSGETAARARGILESYGRYLSLMQQNILAP